MSGSSELSGRVIVECQGSTKGRRYDPRSTTTHESYEAEAYHTAHSDGSARKMKNGGSFKDERELGSNARPR